SANVAARKHCGRCLSVPRQGSSDRAFNRLRQHATQSDIVRTDSSVRFDPILHCGLHVHPRRIRPGWNGIVRVKRRLRGAHATPATVRPAASVLFSTRATLVALPVANRSGVGRETLTFKGESTVNRKSSTVFGWMSHSGRACLTRTVLVMGLLL